MTNIQHTNDDRQQKEALVEILMAGHQRRLRSQAQDSGHHLKEMASDADLNNPYITRLFADTVMDLRERILREEADIRASLETQLGLHDEPDDPMIIEGEVIVDDAANSDTPQKTSFPIDKGGR